ncbi:MAG TPA: hypothetical protein VE422_46920 [Terriglobia bacterium]|nr:hypothetical protein [Terriglobia bacterium]
MAHCTKSFFFSFFRLASIAILFLGSAPAQSPIADESPDWVKAPLAFEPNLGQAGLDAPYVTRGSGYNIAIQPTETRILLGSAKQGLDKSALVRIKMLRARADAPAFATNELPGRSNYLVGNDSSKWLSNIPLYGQVRFENVYHGVDAVYYGTDGKLEFDFVVAPGVDPRIIQLDVDGADRFGLDNGDLSISTRAGDLTLHKPVAYQDVDGVRRPIESSYVIDGHQRIRFRLARYDTTRALVIDPQLSYLWNPYSSANFVDIGEWDQASGVAFRSVTGGQEVFVTGSFKNFDRAQAVDAFVGKFASNGTLQYRTVIGGDGDDFGLGIAAVSTGSDAGKVFVAGMTASSNFPCKVYTASSAPANCSGSNPSFGSSDGFIMKLNTSGLLDAFSRRIGGALGDRADSVVIVPSGSTYEVYVAGSMQSDLSLLPGSGFSASYALLPTDWNGYVVKVDSGNGAFSLGRYFGPVDVPPPGYPVRGLKVSSDASSPSLYVAGTTSSTLPCSGICTPAAGSVPSGTKGYVVKVVNGAVLYVTHISGSDAVYGTAAAANATAAYVTGSTLGNLSLPCPSGSCTRGQGMDAFVARLDTNGVPTQFTYLGADLTDNGMDLVLDSFGNPLVTGDSANPMPGAEFPVQGGSHTNLHGGGIDAFITKLNLNLGVISTTFIGRTDDNTADFGKSLVTTGGITYATGYSVIPGTFGYSFVAKLDETIPSIEDLSIDKCSTAQPCVVPRQLAAGGGTPIAIATVKVTSSIASCSLLYLEGGSGYVTFGPPQPTADPLKCTFEIRYQSSTPLPYHSENQPSIVARLKKSATDPTVVSTSETRTMRLVGAPELISLNVPSQARLNSPVAITVTFDQNSFAGMNVRLDKSGAGAPNLDFGGGNSISQSVPNGATQVTFNVSTTGTLANDAVVTIKATFVTPSGDGSVLTANMTIKAPPPVPFALDRVELNPTSVIGGTTPVSGTVYLLCPSGPPASTQAVNMSFSPGTAGITITPNPVNIVNACSGTFTVGTTAVSTATTVRITATLGSSTKSKDLTINRASSGDAVIKFKDFDVDVDIDSNKRDDDDNFLLRGEFTLGDQTNGINPVIDQVTLQLNRYTLTVPPNSFRKYRVGDWQDYRDRDDDDRDRDGHRTTDVYRFYGTINGDRIYIVIRGFGHNEYIIWAFGHRADLTRAVDRTPITVNLVIGNDGGTATDEHSRRIEQ